MDATVKKICIELVIVTVQPFEKKKFQVTAANWQFPKRSLYKTEIKINKHHFISCIL
jgi:hypothetical protein